MNFDSLRKSVGQTHPPSDKDPVFIKDLGDKDRGLYRVRGVWRSKERRCNTSTSVMLTIAYR